MNRVNLMCLLAAVLVLPASPEPSGAAAASTANRWRLLSETPLPPQAFRVPVGVYDPARHRVLVVDTWSASFEVHVFEPGSTPRWSVLETSGTPPTASTTANIVYDPARDRLLVFTLRSPDSAAVFALELSGTPTWRALPSQGNMPAPRLGYSLITDRLHDRVILFGGWTGALAFSDTWSYSLTTGEWAALAVPGPSPGAREGHGAIYDPVQQRMVVFGGHYEDGRRHFRNDLWELSLGTTPAWSEITAIGPLPGARSAFGMVYDPVRRRLFVHAGINADSGVEPDDLWALALDGPPVWVRVETLDTFRGRSYPIDVYDPVSDAFLACGGGGYAQVAKLSLSAPERWEAVLPTLPLLAPGPRTSAQMVLDSNRDRILILAGDLEGADSPSWAFSPEHAQPWRPIESIRSEFDLFLPSLAVGECSSLTFDAARDRLLYFDGTQVLSSPADRPGDWTPLGPALTEPGSGLGRAASLVIDTRRDRLIVAGGWIPLPHSDDYTTTGVWELTLGPDPTWRKLGTMPETSGAAGQAAYYDAAGDRLIMVGGFRLNGGLLRTRVGAWIWTTPVASELDWSLHGSRFDAAIPAPPFAHAAFDPQQRRIYLFDGVGTWTRGVDDTVGWREIDVAGPGLSVGSRVIFDSDRSQLVALFSAMPGHVGVQAWALAVGPLAVSLVDSRRTSDAVELSWRSTTAVGKPATLERREAPGDWLPLSALTFDVRGLARFTDHTVLAGHDYAYRVRVADGDSSYVSTPTLVAPPEALRFAMLGARPNPAVERFQLAFSLPDASPARLELFDLRGRRCASREVGTLGAGRHTITLGDANALVPGVYFARLQRGGASQVQRVVLTR